MKTFFSNMTRKFGKMIAVSALAGTLLVVAPMAANAQRIAVRGGFRGGYAYHGGYGYRGGVGVGVVVAPGAAYYGAYDPGYYGYAPAPAYYGPSYYGYYGYGHPYFRGGYYGRGYYGRGFRR